MKTKAHQIYRLKDGTRVPGASTIANMLSKGDALLQWAYNLGLKGEDYKAVRDNAGASGTLAHDMILCHLKNEKVDTSDYSKNQIDKAENSFLSYLEWEKGHKIEPILLETPLTSERYWYGGTPDNIPRLDNEIVLMDYKSGGVYFESFIQGSGYWQLAIENNIAILEKLIILGIPRTEDEKFTEKIYTRQQIGDIGIPIFLKLLEIYYLEKEIR